MKLYLLEIDNGECYEDHHRYCAGVFNTEELANFEGEKIVKELNESHWDNNHYFVREITINALIEY